MYRAVQVDSGGRRRLEPDAPMSRVVWIALAGLALLGGFSPMGFAGSEMVDERDRAVDWAIGGLKEGGRIMRPTPQAGPRKRPGATPSPSDTGAAGTRRPAAERLDRGAPAPRLERGRDVRGAGAGSGGLRPSQQTEGAGTGGGAEESKVGSGETAGAGGEGSQVGVDVSAGAGGTGGVEVGVGGTVGGSVDTQPDSQAGSGSTLDLSLEAETGGGDVGSGSVAVEAEATATSPLGSGDLVNPGTTDATVEADLNTTSTLSGGGEDNTVDSSADEEDVRDDADECTVLGLVSCPSLL